jgi:hypothetical protein
MGALLGTHGSLVRKIPNENGRAFVLPFFIFSVLRIFGKILRGFVHLFLLAYISQNSQSIFSSESVDKRKPV